MIYTGFVPGHDLMHLYHCECMSLFHFPGVASDVTDSCSAFVLCINWDTNRDNPNDAAIDLLGLASRCYA
jgi:hypothetical protein